MRASRRKTRPGDIVRSMVSLAKALDRPCIYLHGAPRATAFIVGMTYHTLRLLMRAKRFRFAVYLKGRA